MKNSFIPFLIGIVLFLLILWVTGIVIYPLQNPTQRYYGIIVSETADPVLRTSCFDCHSNETVYPWYKDLAGVRMILGGHIEEGREHLNFSEWDGYDWQKQRDLLYQALDEIEEGGMPLPMYRLLHRKATLAGDTRTMLQQEVLRKYGPDKRPQSERGHPNHNHEKSDQK